MNNLKARSILEILHKVFFFRISSMEISSSESSLSDDI